ncbi:kynurenine formamidase [Breznakibacter xylanolyticus]|uniref:Kynurenine formamidase n=1 Tax=Breznakibacter xylanolyticus TaxID=990 RepID=A0A2W7N5L8_9BACT|nr:cyclase family protein [Breznakibacter xylanolyticus]PZX13567.1 kynurenine formamidase [Breznakibacter xylanolyticus]
MYIPQNLNVEWLDLSHPIEHRMPTWPEDPQVNLKCVATLEHQGFSNYRLELGMHAGTHIDGPLHMLDHGLPISQINPSTFIGQGIVIDNDEQAIEQLSTRDLKDQMVLIDTKHAQYWGQPTYHTHFPNVLTSIIRHLIDKKVRLIGIDSPSPDHSPYHAHRLILENNIFIIENLTNLVKIPKFTPIQIVALPLSIVADSAPARVVAGLYHHKPGTQNDKKIT